jgi:hypothetical protein
MTPVRMSSVGLATHAGRSRARVRAWGGGVERATWELAGRGASTYTTGGMGAERRASVVHATMVQGGSA